MSEDTNWENKLKCKNIVLEATSNLLLDFSFSLLYINDEIVLVWRDDTGHKIQITPISEDQVNIQLHTSIDENFLSTNAPVTSIIEFLKAIDDNLQTRT